MINSDLRASITDLGLTQAEFARLIGVTPRAVTLWIAGDRAIPGPVEAYARLLTSLPPSTRQVELARLRQGGIAMRDGMYSIEYRSGIGSGIGVLVIESGRVFGVDPLGGKYDGVYTYDEGLGLADLHLKVTLPANVQSIFGIINPYEWSIDVTTKFDPRPDFGQVQLATSIGPVVDANYRYLRPLPDA